MGVDISEEAIQRAKYECEMDTDRFLKNNYIVSDISKYIPDREYNIILFKESLYYINRLSIKKVIRKYHKYLDDRRVIIVRMHDKNRYRYIMRLIEDNYHIIESYTPHNDSTIVIVFK